LLGKGILLMAVFQGEGSLASSQGSGGGLMSPPPVEQQKEEVKVENNQEEQITRPIKRPTITTNINEGVSDEEVNEVVTEFAPAPLGKENVTNLQTYLNKTPNAPNLVVDGMWGPNTSAALRDFKKYKKELYAQEDFEESGFVIDRPKIKTDGILDSEITGIINADLASQNTSVTKKHKYINDVNNYNFGLVNTELTKQIKEVSPLKGGESIMSWFADKLGLDEQKRTHRDLLNKTIKLTTPGFGNVDRSLVAKDPKTGRELEASAWCAAILYAAIKNTNVNGLSEVEGAWPSTKSNRYQYLGSTVYDYNPTNVNAIDSGSTSLEATRGGDMIVFNKGNNKRGNRNGSEFTNDSRGHVGILVQRYSDGSVLVLGGNQDNSVSLKLFTVETIKKSYPAGYKVKRLNNLPSTNPKLIAELTSIATDEIQGTN
jgi:hypothetical protein